MRFHKQVIEFSTSVKKNIDKAYEEIAIELYRRIQEKTPIDTGRAKANWNISKGAPDTTVTTDVVPKKANLGHVRADMDTIYIANYLHYVYALEFGHSGQAPSGMVVISMQEMQRWVESKLRGMM